jgi:hypothetical protein
MGKSDRGLAIALTAALVLFFAPPVLWADCELSGVGDIIQVDKKAKGTRYSGPLTIHYEIIPGDFSCTDGGPKVDMRFFMRLKHGRQLHQFSGIQSGVCYFDIESHQAAIHEFVRTIVIPILYPETPNLSFALKNYDNLVQDIQGHPCCSGMFFVIVDIILAIDD